MYGITEVSNLEFHVDQSYFLRDLRTLLPFYKVSTQVHGSTVAWMWELHGCFSTSSAYKALHHSRITCTYHKKLWKIRAPPKVRIFLWVMLQDKLLTKENLIKKGCHSVQGCALCESNEPETVLHLMWSCLYSLAHTYNCGSRTPSPRLADECGTQLGRRDFGL